MPTRTNIVVQPQVTAACSNRRIPSVELVHCGIRICRNIGTVVSTNNKMKGVTSVTIPDSYGAGVVTPFPPEVDIVVRVVRLSSLTELIPPPATKTRNLAKHALAP